MIRWLAQEHPASCVVACIRMVLDAMGNHLSETTLRQFMGNPRFGLTLGDANRKLNDSGGKTEHHDDWGIDDLRDQIRIGNYPIVGIERYFFGHPFASHAVVVVTITTHEIVFLDPLLELPQTTTHKTFFEAWDFTGKETLIVIHSPKFEES